MFQQVFLIWKIFGAGFVYPPVLLRCVILLGFLPWPVMGGSSVEASGAEYEVRFYNPESNVNNFTSLKIEFDRYLQKFGTYELSPFRNIQQFERHLKGINGILIISSWYYKRLKEQYAIEPVLVGMINGKVTQRKIISTKREVTLSHLLESTNIASIASAGSDKYTRNMLKQLWDKENTSVLNSLQILSVPNDIDALIAVGFGLAKASLTTEYSIDMLAAINPKLSRSLVTVAISDEALLPIVVIPQNHDHEILRLLSLIEFMGQEKRGKIRFQMLGLDGWKRIDTKEMAILEK